MLTHPKDLSIKDFTYILPEEQIAKYPVDPRDHSKLLVDTKNGFEVSVYREIARFLPANSTLIFNDTRVVQARLHFKKPTGSTIELFCLEPADNADIQTAMQQKGSVLWQCLVGGAKKWKEEKLSLLLSTTTGNIELTAEKIQQEKETYVIQFSWNDSTYSFAEILHFAGEIPLPPYLNRAPVSSDQENYQTIYAKQEGSVAAPTAGLHFTENIFQELNKKNITQHYLTLHVGAGTFKPVKTDTLTEHDMHAEWIEVSITLLQYLQQATTPIVCVGTTSLRTIESLYWIGLKTLQHSDINTKSIMLGQWEAYTLMPSTYSRKEVLNALIQWMKKNNLSKLITKTQILIAPGYTFKIADGLITNFHQPQSTLLLLIAAITGNRWKAIYDYALAQQFRFLSYGDGCLLWINEPKD